MFKCYLQNRLRYKRAIPQNNAGGKVKFKILTMFTSSSKLQGLLNLSSKYKSKVKNISWIPQAKKTN